MKTQAKLEKFKSHIMNLIHLSEKEYAEEPGGESQGFHYRDRHQTIATNILKHLIEPRMEVAADLFDDASLDVNVDVGYVRLSFLRREPPAAIYLLFCLRLDYSARLIRLYAEVCLKPFSLDHEPSAVLVMTLGDSDFQRVEVFIEEQILKFIKGYLRTRHYSHSLSRE